MNRFLVVDFETTGNHPRQGDQIIQIGAVAIDDGQITQRYSTFVNPGQPIPPFITALTGITDEMVADAPCLPDVLPDLLRLLDGRTFVAHNALFDLHFLQEALQSQGYYTFDGFVLDTVELARFLLPMQAGYRLVELADDFELKHDQPHRADSDALATAQLFLRLLAILRDLPLVTLQRLQMLVSSFRSDIGELLRAMELEKLAEAAFAGPGETDGGQEDERWDIYRQLALRQKTAAQPKLSAADAPTFELDILLEQILGEDGALARRDPGYERREAQEAMMRAIYTAMKEGTHMLVEAGTGTGKSLGYLLPAILWAKWNQQQVVISTHTIHLQEQLFQKEIPQLQAVLPFSFSAARLKGRGNYLCLRKFEQSLHPAETSSQEVRLAKAQILTWLTQTETGDVEEISLTPAGAHYWQTVQSDTASCLHRRCPWFSRCFYFRAKEQAREADILIVNHALLLNDLHTDSRLLPAYQVAVIDEAHQLEDVASQQLGSQLSTAHVAHLLERLSPEPTGLTGLFAEELDIWDSALGEQARSRLADLSNAHEKARDVAQQWTQLLYHWALKRANEQTETGRAAVRYPASGASERSERLNTATSKLIKRLGECAERTEQLLALIRQGDGQPPHALLSLKTDLAGVVDEVRNVLNTLHALLLDTDPDVVRWLEVEARGSRKQVHVFSAPLDVSAALVDKLFAEKRSVTLTSATLTVKNRFDYLMERCGLDRLSQERVRTLSLPSAFDYEKNGLLLIPSDFPSLTQDGEEPFLDAVIQGCADAVRAAKGRTLILLTAYSMLKRVYDGLKQQLDEEGYTLLGHGIDSQNRSKLIRKFQREPRMVLLGTSSFWEGVDIPGEALSCVVIVRLPFLPLNQPLVTGRSERLKEQGKNPFMSFHLPHAVIRFKQGLGRLIRHQNDRGVVIVFDTRIVEARYGRAFLESLPPYRVESGPWLTLREWIRPFLDGMSPPSGT